MFNRKKFIKFTVNLGLLTNLAALPSYAWDEFIELQPSTGSYVVTTVSDGSNGPAQVFIPNNSALDSNTYSRLIKLIKSSSSSVWSAEYELFSISPCKEQTDWGAGMREGVCLTIGAEPLDPLSVGALPGTLTTPKQENPWGDVVIDGRKMTLTLDPADSKALHKAGIETMLTERFRMDCRHPETGCSLDFALSTKVDLTSALDPVFNKTHDKIDLPGIERFVSYGL